MSATELPAAFPSDSANVTLRGGAGAIEAVASSPDVKDARKGIAIICHPHPLQGGTMHNKVVTMVERSLRELGFATIIFNFRGVGASAGTFDDGRGETDDVLAIAAWAQRVRPDDVLWLAGFSFGSYVAARAASQLPVRQLISIAPPIGRWDFDALTYPSCPWLIIQGEADGVVDPQAVYTWVAAHTDPPRLVRLPETGHFFHRRLMDLRDVIKEGVRTNLPPRIDGTMDSPPDGD